MPVAYLQEACVGAHRQVELGSVCDEEDVAVDEDRGPDRPEEEAEDVAGLLGGHYDRAGKVVHL